ncbi:MAG: hypothetical protein EBU13_01305 [Synechococcaceae bacterium WB5_2A_257]|nr:hypothetical protein [Synechococcaceae bacterium WB5_2A_257]
MDLAVAGLDGLFRPGPELQSAAGVQQVDLLALQFAELVEVAKELAAGQCRMGVAGRINHQSDGVGIAVGRCALIQHLMQQAAGGERLSHEGHLRSAQCRCGQQHPKRCRPHQLDAG